MRIPKLRTVLYANTAFSTISGMVILVFSGWIAERVLDFPSIVYLLMGAGLLGFAAAVFYVAQTVPATMVMARWVLWADISWVLVTPVAILLLADRLTSLDRNCTRLNSSHKPISYAVFFLSNNIQR